MPLICKLLVLASVLAGALAGLIVGAVAGWVARGRGATEASKRGLPWIG